MSRSQALPVLAVLTALVFCVASFGFVLASSLSVVGQAASGLPVQAIAPMLAADSAAAPPVGGTATATATPPTDSMEGVWEGSWHNETPIPGDGTFRVEMHQVGQAITGTMSVTDSPCLTTATVSGTVSGSNIQFGIISGQVTGNYTGTLTGNKTSGRFQLSSVCLNASGTWNATKVSPQ